MTLIELRDLDKAYKTGKLEYQALKKVNVEIHEGELTAIVGPSGCGKSTMLNMITGIDRPTSGSVTIGGERIDTMKEDRLASWKHFASWLGLSPNNKVSGGKVLHQRPTSTANRATQAFRLAARSLHHSKSSLGAYYRRVMAKNGRQVAIKACAHKLARIVYAMVSTQAEFHDLGEHYYEERFRNRTLRHLKRKAANLGFQLIALPQPAGLAGVS